MQFYHHTYKEPPESATIQHLNMADIFVNSSSSSSSAFTILEQARQEFWNSNAHLTEEQRQDAWATASLYPNNAFNTPAQPTMAQHIPRTMPNSSMSNLMQYPVWNMNLLVVALPAFSNLLRWTARSLLRPRNPVLPPPPATPPSQPQRAFTSAAQPVTLVSGPRQPRPASQQATTHSTRSTRCAPPRQVCR